MSDTSSRAAGTYNPSASVTMADRAITLSDLAVLPRWVVWRNESRNGKATKVPYRPSDRRKAESNDPLTWATRKAAELAVPSLVNGSGGGIGLMLGHWDDGAAIGGIDLDSCRNSITGEIEPWAQSVIDRFASYCEFSPSGSGVKIFFAWIPEKRDALKAAMKGQFGRKWARPGKGHPPAIELYLSHRYFALTDKICPGSTPDIEPVSLETLLWLINEGGPAFVAKAPRAASAKPNQRLPMERSGDSTDGSNLNLEERIAHAVGASRSLERRWNGDWSGLLDNSASGRAMSLGALLKSAGFDFRNMCAALRLHPDTAVWAREKGEADGGREFGRIWEKAGNEASDEYTDDALALRFTQRYGAKLRYVAKWGCWFRWDGTVWRQDDTLAVLDHARVICREACEEARSKRIAAAWTIAAVERLARADRQHAATTSQWDADPWLLNTPGGTVDLRTGKMVAQRPDQYQTKITAVAPDANVPEQWLAFLDRIFQGDRDLIDYVQRAIGYCLTGLTTEHALFFAYGTGGNGKGVFINTLAGILADYAKTAPMETFTVSQSDRHPTELAMLRGARFVTAQETEEGRRLAESRIKSLTGGDPITARFMRQDFFEFMPQFKLLIAGNHKPELRTVDEAIRRRMHLIPFAVTIAPTECDPMLTEKLQGEWPRILNWTIEGCLKWQKIGLVPPEAVVNATREYLDSEDAIGTWLSDCCDMNPNGFCLTGELYTDWKSWAGAHGEFVGSIKRFSQLLKSKGFRSDRQSGTGRQGFTGLRRRAGDETKPDGTGPEMLL